MYSLPSAAELTKNVSDANSKSKSSFNNIEESGKYRLKIEAAEWSISPSGAKSVIFHLISDTDKTAKVELYYTKRDGSRNDFSANKLEALMVVCKVKNLTSSNDSVMKWSKVERCMAEESINGCPELKGKWFTGLIQIEKDAYIKDGEPKEVNKHNFYGVFQDQTELSALEIMNRVTVADEVHECESGLNGFLVRYTEDHKRLISGEKTATKNSGSYAAPAKVDEDDDIPF